MNHHLMLLCLQLKMLQCVARYVNNVKINKRFYYKQLSIH
jgi:hypothetical protein